MPRCVAIKPDGTQCERVVPASQTHCYSHDERRAADRRQAASVAASAKHAGSEISQDRNRLKEIAEGCLDGSIDRARASIAAQVYGVRIRYFEQERKQREAAELEQRLDALEAAAQQAAQGPPRRRTWVG